MPRDSSESDSPSGAAHRATLERALGRIFAVFIALMVVAFWSSSATLPGQRLGTMAAMLVLSVLLVWQAARALRRPPSQRDVWLLAAASGVLLLVSRALTVRGNPFPEHNANVLVMPVAAAWAVWSARFVIPVPVLLVASAAWAWASGEVLPTEQAVDALAIVACTSWGTRLMRAGARRADADALSGRIAAQDAELAAEEAERRAANTVHDDVLSVLRAVSVADRPLPWSILASKARAAQESLARQVPLGGDGLVGLGLALRRQANAFAAELDVRCDIDDDLDVPLSAAEALSAAAGEALRNVAAHAGVRSTVLTSRTGPSGGVKVTISDEGIGFDPDRVGPASSGLRNSIRARLKDIGGGAEVISTPGQGTSVALTWNPPSPASIPVADPLDLARRMAPSPRLIFSGFMLPVLLIGLVSLRLRWQDMRWQAAAAAVLLGFVGVAVLCARCLGQVQMKGSTAVGLAAANPILAAVGALAVAPGTTDSFAYWVGNASGIVIAAVYFIQGPVFGLTALALDMSALTAGLLVTGGALSPGVSLSIVTAPAIGAGVAAAMLAAFRSLSGRTESQLVRYRERVRLQARVEAISRADRAALENARRVAGPILELVVSGQAPNPLLRMAARLATSTLRDELLAPGFMITDLAERVRAARIAEVQISVDFERQADAALVDSARGLLTAALADLGSGDEITLRVHPQGEGRPALLLLHVRSTRLGHVALCRSADKCGAVVSDLGDHELLVRLAPSPRADAGTRA